MSKLKKSEEKFSFGQSVDQLSTLLARMETGDLSLEDTLEAFETGIRLVRKTQLELDKTEQSVQILIEQDGIPAMKPLASDIGE